MADPCLIQIAEKWASSTPLAQTHYHSHSSAKYTQVYGSKPPAAGKKGQQAPISSAAALREFVVMANISKRVVTGAFVCVCVCLLRYAFVLCMIKRFVEMANISKSVVTGMCACVFLFICISLARFLSGVLDVKRMKEYDHVCLLQPTKWLKLTNTNTHAVSHSSQLQT